MPLQPAGLWVRVFFVKPLLALDGGGLQAIRDATGATVLLCERPGGLEGQSLQPHMVEVTSPDADADGFKTAVEMLERCSILTVRAANPVNPVAVPAWVRPWLLVERFVAGLVQRLRWVDPQK